MFDFEVTSSCSNTEARTGIFHTPNGLVATPKFMPVGTSATVKGISSKQLKSTGSEMILSNTFHLHLQPGEKLIKDAGGIHEFMNSTCFFNKFFTRLKMKMKCIRKNHF